MKIPCTAASSIKVLGQTAKFVDTFTALLWNAHTHLVIISMSLLYLLCNVQVNVVFSQSKPCDKFSLKK